MPLIIGILLNLSSSAMLAEVSGLKGKTSFILGVFLLFSSQIVIIAQVLSELHLLTRNSFLISQGIVFGLIFAYWQARGRPFNWEKFDLIFPIVRIIKTDSCLAVLFCLVALGLAAAFILALALPPSNFDSMTYHLPRVMHWIQNGTLRPYFTTIWRQLHYPINAALGLLWLMLLSGSDRLLNLLQWSASFGIMLAIYGIGRRIKLNPGQRLFGALLFFTLPAVVCQLTTTQNDLITAFFIITCFYFLLSGNLIFSALALGLGLGAKLTALFILPGLAITAMAAVKDKKKAIFYLIAALIAFGILGFYNYFYSLRFFLNPSNLKGGINLTQDSALVNAAHSLINYIRGFFDFANYVHEDTSYFGPLGFLVYLPLLVFYLIPVNFKRHKIEGCLALSGALFLITYSITVEYNPWAGRFFIIMVGLLSAPAGWLYQENKSWLRHSLAAIAGVVLVISLIGNESKNLGLPWAQRPVIYKLDRMSQQFINAPEKLPLYQAIDQAMPDEASIGVIFGTDDWEYPLFGRRLTRRVIHIPLKDGLIDGDLADYKIDYLLINNMPETQELIAGSIDAELSRRCYFLKLAK